MPSSSEDAQKRQYTRNGILRYEFLFGKGYVSSGGSRATEEVLKVLKVNKGGKALDIGCGIGGTCSAVSAALDIDVEGIDLSPNMIDIAAERYASNPRLRFAVADCTKEHKNSASTEFKTTQHAPANGSAANVSTGEKRKEGVLQWAGQYTLVYTRDTLLHLTMEQKRLCIRNVYSWLTPGGQFFITDYICGPRAQWSAEFTRYVESRGYTLLELEEYKQVLTEVGFRVTLAKCQTELWRTFLKDEVARLADGQQTKQQFLSAFSAEDLDELKEGWERKLERSERGEQGWGWLLAVKD